MPGARARGCLGSVTRTGKPLCGAASRSGRLALSRAPSAAGVTLGAGLGAFDSGIDDKRMRRLGAGLEPGQAALCALVGEADWPVVRARMSPLAGELLVAELTPEAEAELRAAREQA